MTKPTTNEEKYEADALKIAEFLTANPYILVTEDCSDSKAVESAELVLGKQLYERIRRLSGGMA